MPSSYYPEKEGAMKRSLLAVVAAASLSGCGSGDTEEKGGDAFEQMVILEEDPSGPETLGDRKDEFKVR
jgi:hypothetical protein